MTLLSYSYSITGISGPAVTCFIHLKLIIRGGTETVTNNSPAFLEATGYGSLVTEPLDVSADVFDLSQETAPKVWTNLKEHTGGFAAWTPAADGQPARLLLEEAYLEVDLKLPSTDVELLFHDRTVGSEVVNVSGAANLTLRNLGGQTAMLKAMSEAGSQTTPPAVSAANGVTFAGGSFSVWGRVTPQATLTAGELTIMSGGGEGGNASQTLTVTPNPVVMRSTLSPYYATAEAGNSNGNIWPILGGSFTDSRTYTGADTYIHAKILARDTNKSFLNVVNGTGGGEYAPGANAPIQGTGSGTFTGWTPEANVSAPASESATYKIPSGNPAEYTVTANYSTGGSTGPSVSSYAVTYKANYPGGPADVRDGGHGYNSTVTAKAATTFAAPAGKTFAGWAETADGPVKYKAGERFRMPAKDLTLYAVWREGGPQPGLNKTDHIAYLTGYPDGTVGPEGNITREETAMIFYRLLDDATREYYETAEHPFADVEAGRWSETAIATLRNAGILEGRSGRRFDPGAPITRAEFAAIAARFDPGEYTGEDLFPDIGGHWARELINRAAKKGWVQGMPTGLFEPDRPITRAEAAALVNRVLGRAPEAATDLLSGMKTWPDNEDPAAWYYLDLQEAGNGHEYERKEDGVHEQWTKLT